MHDIQADMHLSSQENVIAYGTVTVGDCIRFTVFVRKYTGLDGEEKIFISYPRLLKKGEWRNVLTLEGEVREQIQEAVGEALKREITRDLYLPPVEVEAVVPVPQKVQGRAVICAVASIKTCGVSIHGITIKRGEKGYFVNMPQFQTASGKWQDAVYGTSAAMQQNIKEAVLEEYQKILRENGKEQT